jgi:hypothetical protein
MLRDLALVLIFAAIVVLAIRTGEGRAPRLLVRSAVLTADQIPLVAPCITPAPQPPKPERRA